MVVNKGGTHEIDAVGGYAQDPHLRAIRVFMRHKNTNIVASILEFFGQVF
jgi:hypothetical protein